MTSGVWAPRKIGAGIADFRQERLRIGDRQLDMLGGEAVGERDRILNRIDQNDAAEILPALRGDIGARQRHQLPLDRLFDGKRESPHRR